jgi:GH15 family glucan-1,4-alpha-glucosidase
MLSVSIPTLFCWEPMSYKVDESSYHAPSIADYALIGDCRTAALVSRNGSIDWLCLPSFSSPTVFARLLDEAGGMFALQPDEPFTTTRRYVCNTAVLETTYTTLNGVARVFDFLPIGDGLRQIRSLRELVRVVEGVSGTVRFAAIIDLRPGYARHICKPCRKGRLGWRWVWGNEAIYVRTDTDLEQLDTKLLGRFSVVGGQRRRFVLCYVLGEPAILAAPEHTDRQLTETVNWWERWSAQVQYEGIGSSAVARSAVTLKLLSFAPSGAIVAAPTAGLPETVGGDRNWDYRYCWLRDAGWTMQALVALGIHADATAFLEWMLHATRLTQPRLRIMYDVYGRTGLMECELPHLAGFRGSRPVRIGNGAYNQQQSDVYGVVMLAAYSYAASGGSIDRASGRMLAGLGKVIRKTWRDPDSGIWEIRGSPRQYTFSKLMCWTGLDRLLALHDLGAVSLGRDLDATRADRDAIAALIDEKGFNEALNAYTGEIGGNTVDASLLMMSAVGFRSGDDTRVTATEDLVRRRLAINGLLLRYEPGVDGLEGDEGAFGICSFWAVEQVARRGDVSEAERQFTHLLSFANDLELFAEEIDAKSGEMLGNFPQAFTHVGLINAAVAIQHARKNIR